MLIGHNPAIEQLALDLARPSLERREFGTKSRRPRSPSSSSNWRDAQRGGATLVNVVQPRDLDT
jgi:hypothetical protein